MKDDAHPEERVKLSPGAWYQTMPLVVCLFVLLFALYMLTYNGTFHCLPSRIFSCYKAARV